MAVFFEKAIAHKFHCLRIHTEPMKLFLAAALGLQGCAQAIDVYQSIKALPNTKTFVSIIDAAGLDVMLSDPVAKLTVFVPTDDAYNAWPDYQLKYVLQESGSADKFGLYAIHTGILTTDQMTAPMNITTNAPNYQLYVQTASDSSAQINDATCGVGQTTQANMIADNGVFHLVDTVFQPPAAICPDKLFAAEQRTNARISSYGYECRSKNETRHLYISENQKPVGLAQDDKQQLVFWANDQDYPRRSPTSWISKVGYNESGYAVVNGSLIDPQGVFADETNQILYFASHSGYEIAKMNYDGTGLTTVYGQPGNLNFQPSDVVVDVELDRVFTSVEGTDTMSGSLWTFFTNGSNATQLLPNENATAGLIQNYGLCLDTYKKHIYWVQGGHGGSIHCLEYGTEQCPKETIIDGLNYPYMCDIDNAFAPYGGPTRIAWSEANRPGSVYYAWANGTDEELVNVTVSTDLDAPMGLAFGCSPF